ncbi:hypothetical protein EV356DRAFT_371303 [Viridothelium virens]|uniref:Uncharacterized protein n=1 Tax=Viridothelium virens TaxID=1048519 RepID=A0A6A6GWN7_VIRVR|nr:hypothetical protein EV356DRAFT_371303 [Viridothelium virens]
MCEATKLTPANERVFRTLIARSCATEVRPTRTSNPEHPSHRGTGYGDVRAEPARERPRKLAYRRKGQTDRGAGAYAGFGYKRTTTVRLLLSIHEVTSQGGFSCNSWSACAYVPCMKRRLENETPRPLPDRKNALDLRSIGRCKIIESRISDARSRHRVPYSRAVCMFGKRRSPT